MPKKKTDLKTVIGVVLDETGSMQGRQEETISSVNYYFDEVEKTDPNAEVIFAEFSDMGSYEEKVRFLSDGEKVTDIPYLDVHNYRPRGNTPLYDAIGHVLTKTEAVPADRYLFVIVTDGLENASKDFNAESVKKMIDERQATDKWTFVYLAAGAEAWKSSSLVLSNSGYGVGQFRAPDATPELIRTAARATRNYLVSSDTTSKDFFAGTEEESSKPKASV